MHGAASDAPQFYVSGGFLVACGLWCVWQPPYLSPSWQVSPHSRGPALSPSTTPGRSWVSRRCPETYPCPWVGSDTQQAAFCSDTLRPPGSCLHSSAHLRKRCSEATAFGDSARERALSFAHTPAALVWGGPAVSVAEGTPCASEPGRDSPGPARMPLPLFDEPLPASPACRHD